ncbi:Y-family DNA polymerase [Aquabacterium sp.]|uniref:Y-family DNA polymerase n=1 Tax=Aquabacterium sp. TaxID=1872578 RepID=UPI002CDDEBC4|nr:DNA polymerase Y family protein [Aquabacterium sp.]HSW04432.1 DNA polymerase Y family protein [Aquabacterium sp.]
MLWIGVHLPLLSLETFASTLGPAQAGRPLALVETQHIVQADAAARARGVRPGIKRVTALALAPELLLGQADHRRDAEALLAVAHAALAFTPAVALSDEAGRAGVRLEVQASLRYFRGLPALLQRLELALAPLGHQLQIATAPTALGAALLASWRTDLALGPHSTDLAVLRRWLDEAPVWLLGPGREHWEALQGMGLRYLSDLRKLPRSGLARRFSPELLLDLDRARGDAPEPQCWVTLAPRFDSRLELFARADTSAQVLAGARILLARLVAWAQAQHGRIPHFTLLMHHEPRHRSDAAVPASTPLEIALAEAAVDADHLQQLLAERLGRLPLQAPALELSLHCDGLVAGSPPNAELFPTRASEAVGLTRLIERLQARLGREQVCGLRLVADHRPERATVAEPADAAAVSVASVPLDTRNLVPQLSRDSTVTRPAWLLPEPLPLPDKAGLPWFEGRPLQLLAGPERIESGWWDSQLVTRDYFIASQPDGALVWIFCERLPQPRGQSSGWFLQGRFA